MARRAERSSDDGEAATIDILLQNNLIDLPVTRWDANNFTFDVQKDASILHGTNNVFAGADSGPSFGGMHLDVIAQGTATRFSGANFGSVEDKSREIAVHQDNVGGLSVTRKVFVPAAGYFARYLELLTNPTDTPVTVDVRVSTGILRSNGSDLAPAVVATSSGDDQLDVTDPATRDRWLVIDAAQPADPFASFTPPSTAFVFDGPGGARAVGSAVLLPSASQIALSPRELDYQWSSVTIQPGDTVGLMHFAVQETSRSAAQAAAERLLQLPPEALAGLSTDELAQVGNFAAPGDGVSALAPLAPLTGSITGRALASDAIDAGGRRVGTDSRAATRCSGRTGPRPRPTAASPSHRP